jgi:ATP-dependent exoDNAse (exonuclease V) beta subunit
VGTYWAVKQQLLAQPATRACHLRACFRLVPALQHAVNAAFGPVMTGQQVEEQADYVALEPVRSDVQTQPALVALSVPRPYATRNVSARAIEECLPDTVGAFVAWLVQESGWTVVEPGPDGVERRVPVQARHVALLFRRFVSWGSDVTRPYLQALEARGVPHLLVGGRTFHAREEVEAIRVALAAIEWPDDELSIYATLRGLLFAIPDHVLLAYREAAPGRRLDPFRLLGDEGATPVAQAAAETSAAPAEGVPGGTFADVVDALRLLRRLHKRRNLRPAHETLHALLTDTRAHAALALRPGGEQALANVLHITEMARQYELTGGLSFRGFVSQLLDRRFTDVSEAPLLEEGSDGVRLMTVHKAKGLEFPIVILADITCGLAGRSASRHLDAATGLCAQWIAGCTPVELAEHDGVERARDRAEGHRLAYVAATRARDVLVVPAVGDAPYPSGMQGERWVDVLNAVLYPPVDDRTRPSPAPGCPSFGKDTVLDRPDGGLPGPTTVRPGLYRFDPGGGYDVVWWDPQQLHLDATVTFGARQLALVDKAAPESRVTDGLREESAWAERRAATREAGQRPRHRVARVTVAAAQEGEASEDVRVERVASRVSDRPRGRAFGTLVHEVLAEVALDATPADVEALALLKGRMLGLASDDSRAAAVAAEAVLGHPLLVRGRAAAAEGRCRREWPVMAKLPDGHLVEGQLDLAFEEAPGWTVVDFKTDEPTPDSRLVYRRQLARYCAALRESTGRPVSGVILQV